MTTYLVAVHLLVETGTNSRADVTAALADILDGDGAAQERSSALVDWAVAWEDLAASMVPVDLRGRYRPNETPFPDWPAVRSGTFTAQRVP